MAILKCKMCGGDLNLQDEMTVAECEYCGTKQTVPTADNEKKMTLFARANRLRAACEFDKAAGVYESIVADFPEEAEAYWGLVLCKYGIEYVDDPATGKKIPTCHRSSFDSIMDDIDFEQVMENADSIARRVYREEAKTIEDIRKGIIEVSSKEEPYDIFICYKETDENGERTIDSVIAQDIYKALTDEGYRVFFARISLEDKLGTAYEPYIFAALNSAKVMLAVGTDYDYYNAVWVKNEWSRFLALIAKGEKKTLIPCYKDIDAYDIPKEFKHLQAQDMGKVGAMQDLLRGIGKLIPKKKQEAAPEAGAVYSRTNEIQTLLKRVTMFLEDGEWSSAIEYAQKVLDKDPENAKAYLGLTMANNKCHSKENFESRYIEGRIGTYDKNLKRAQQFAGEKLNAWFGELDEAKAEADVKKAEEKEKQKKEQAEEEARKQEEERRKQAEEQARCENEKKRLQIIREQISKYRNLVSAGDCHTVGLKSDGTVTATKYSGDRKGYFGQCDVASWTDILAVSAGNEHTLGLKADRTAVAVGDDYNGKRDVSGWRGIVAASSGIKYTVGLKSDGTVVAVGNNGFNQCDVYNWKNIVAISAGYRHTLGLKADGTVVAVGKNEDGQCDVSDWKDIVAVSAGYTHTVGLKDDGTVVAVGKNEYGQCDVSNWTDIVAVSAGSFHTVGLKSDGTVVAVGSNDYGQCELSNWKDTVAVSAGEGFTIGLKSDGTVVAVGFNNFGQCDVASWKLFKSEAEIEADYLSACQWQSAGKSDSLKRAADMFRSLKDYKDSVERAKECTKPLLNEEKNSLQTELSNLKGIFSGKRRKQIEARLVEIDQKIKDLN